MRLSSRTKTCLLLLLILALVLTGCGKSSGKTAETNLPEPEITAAPTAEPTQVPTPEPTFTPTPEPTPEPTATPSPSPTPTPSPTPEPTPFTIAWMSDTQNLSRSFPEVFNSMRDWVLENREKQNIVFFAHTGDVVDALGPEMKKNAEEALTPVVEAIPGMIASGNHDQGPNGEHYWFVDRSYVKAVQKEGQTYLDGCAAYTTFEAAGEEFLVLGIGYNINTRFTAWVDRVISEHPGAIVIYVLHFGMEENGHLSGQAKKLFDTSIKNTPTARLMLCGHMRGSVRRTDWFDDNGDGESERSFTSMMFNYQDDFTDGLGYLRLLTFYPVDRHIEVKTYSPWLDSWHYVKAAEGDDEFTLPDAF